jgi:release factor glutamine methyltransferase
VIALAEVLRRSTRYLEDRGSPTARLDAELLLAHGLGVSRIELYTAHDRPLTESELGVCRELVRRRGDREPVAYIVGTRGFRHLDLKVDSCVLVPRPETELVVDRCLELLRDVAEPAVLDVGTGSGAIALAIASELSTARVTASDISPAALDIAWANAVALELPVEVRQGDLLDGLGDRRFDLIVSNPPYVSAAEIEQLEPEVAIHEPRLATVAGDDGLDVYRRLLPEARNHLDDGGWLVLECGAGQAGWLAAELGRLGYGHAEVARDLAEIDRVVSARWG